MKKFLIFSMILLLNACKPELSYEYLIKHPETLKKEYAKCEEQELPQCTLVRRTAIDFSELLKAEMEDPEAFGKSVMETQQALVALAALRNQNPESEAAYHEAQKKLTLLYAVIAVHTPE